MSFPKIQYLRKNEATGGEKKKGKKTCRDKVVFPKLRCEKILCAMARKADRVFLLVLLSQPLRLEVKFVLKKLSKLQRFEFECYDSISSVIKVLL